jgi:hypothetical protein
LFIWEANKRYKVAMPRLGEHLCISVWNSFFLTHQRLSLPSHQNFVWHFAIH